MLSDRLETFDPVESAEADFTDAEYARKWLRGAGVGLALAGYIAAAAFILSSNTAKIYGFAVSHDLRTLIEIALQICPMMVALFLLPLSRVKDLAVEAMVERAIRAYPPMNPAAARILAVAGASALGAVAVVLATAAVITAVCGFQPAGVSPLTLLWVAAEFTFDIALVSVFTSLLYALTRRVWATVLIFMVYVAVVVFAGTRWGITSYIGFGSTVPVMLTTYSTAPLYDEAGWMLRAYWTCVTLLLLSILYVFDVPGRPLLRAAAEKLRGGSRPGPRAWAAILTLSLICAGTCASLVRLQRYGKARYQAPPQATLARALQGNTAETRLELIHFTIRLAYVPAGAVAVDGSLVLRNGHGPVRTAYFQVPGLMTVDDLRFEGAGPYEIRRLGTYMLATFAEPIPEKAQVRLTYKGSVRPAGAFDLAVQAKVLGKAFFLGDTDLLVFPRSAGCLAASLRPGVAVCATENYLMNDVATGNLIVVAPHELGVATVGAESVRNLGRGMTEHVFTIQEPRLAAFMVACARFRQAQASASDGAAIRVFRSAGATAEGEPEAPIAASILSYYQSVWPVYSRRELKIVEMPTPLGEAMAFDGMIAVSDKIMASRSPASGAPSNLLEFVMAHEIAHQWWGYRVVPARSPGRTFLMESVAQFAAYKFLDGRGILSERDAARNELRRYRAARGRIPSEAPVAKAEAMDEVAYNKGPFVLLSLDRLGGGSLMPALGGLIRRFSQDLHGNTRADELAATLIQGVAEPHRQTATDLLYATGERGVEDR